MPDDLVLAVIGAGKIGRSLIAAVRRRAPQISVVATAKSDESLRKAEELGAEPIRSNVEAVRRASVVVLSVKPADLPKVLSEIGGHVEGKAVISFVAGVRIATLTRVLRGAEIYRAMPNINALVGMSTTALSLCPECRKWKDAVVRILETLGEVFIVPEDWLDAWTALIGSGPAYVAEFVESLVLAALEQGIPGDLALRAVISMAKSTLEHILRRGLHPAALRDEVITPGGTTIAGLRVLWERGFRSAVMEAVASATRRCAELAARVNSALRAELRLDSA